MGKARTGKLSCLEQVLLLMEHILSIRRPHLRRLWSSGEANRKSQKSFPFEKEKKNMVEKHDGASLIDTQDLNLGYLQML